MNSDRKSFVEAIKIVSNEEAENADAIVCMYYTHPLLDPANGVGKCAGTCGKLIQWSQSSPVKPKKLCIPCAQDSASEDNEVSFSISKKTSDKVNEYIRKQRH